MRHWNRVLTTLAAVAVAGFLLGPTDDLFGEEFGWSEEPLEPQHATRTDQPAPRPDCGTDDR